MLFLVAAHPEPKAVYTNVLTSDYLFYSCYCGIYSSVSPHYRWRFTHYSCRLHDFSVTVPQYCKDVCFSSFFLVAGTLWNSLQGKCFFLNHYINFKFRVNKNIPIFRLLTVSCSILFCLFFVLLLYKVNIMRN